MTTPKKEYPYQETPQVQRIQNTLIYFGMQRLESRYMAREIAKNLDNYLTVMDAVAQRVPYNTAARPTQTAWRTAHGDV
jgi:hypothetical protein